MNEHPLSKTGDGTENRDRTYVDDIAGGLLRGDFQWRRSAKRSNFGSVKGGRDSIS